MQPTHTHTCARAPGPSLPGRRYVQQHEPLLDAPHGTSDMYLLQPTLRFAPSHSPVVPDSRTAEIKVCARKVSGPTTAPFSRICRPILEGIVSWSRTPCSVCTVRCPTLLAAQSMSVGVGLFQYVRVVCKYAKYECTYMCTSAALSNHDRRRSSGPLRIQDHLDPQEAMRCRCCYYRA